MSPYVLSYFFIYFPFSFFSFCSFFYFFFFFFQAEDGIRGTSVTGVQTCALPICIWKKLAATGKLSASIRGSAFRGSTRTNGTNASRHGSPWEQRTLPSIPCAPDSPRRRRISARSAPSARSSPNSWRRGGFLG